MIFTLYTKLLDFLEPTEQNGLFYSAYRELSGTVGIGISVFSEKNEKIGNKKYFEMSTYEDYTSAESIAQSAKAKSETDDIQKNDTGDTVTPDHTAAPYETTYPIIEKNLASTSIAPSDIELNNDTSYSPNISELLYADSPIEKTVSCFSQEYQSNTYSPIVLILHTHGTEAYSPENTMYYSEGENFRSDDIENNVVAVGKIMMKTLIAHGIPTVHCEIMHDKDSYNKAYSNAAETIRDYLERYPSIKYVFDVHRDSIIYSDGTAVKPVTYINNSPSAQIMCVIGTNELGANHPDWLNNLNVATKLQYIFNSEYSQLARPINLRGAGFNEQYTSGSMILEIGSCANTLSEAKTAGIAAAECIAKLILGQYSFEK